VNTIDRGKYNILQRSKLKYFSYSSLISINVIHYKGRIIRFNGG
jgi:hypothetical protein